MKTQLVELINSYAAARASGDQLLINVSSQMLQDMLNRVEIIEAVDTEEAGEPSPAAEESSSEEANE